MGDWTESGPFNVGQWTDWVGNMVRDVTGNLRGMVGFPREEMLRHMDDFALRSLKRHLDARKADLSDMTDVVDQEIARRESGAAPSPTPSTGPGV